MSDKFVITASGLGCLVALTVISIAIGAFIGIIVAVAKWIAS